MQRGAPGDRWVLARRRLARAALALPLARLAPLRAQPAQRRVGVLGVTPPSQPSRDVFRQAMHELGWAEGRLDALAAELVASGAEVLVTSSAVSTRALQKATTTRPIVMVNVVNPVANGFAASLACPGGNITGLTNQQEDLIGKLLEVLLQLVPQAQRIGFVFNPRNPNHDAYRAVATAASGSFGVAPLRLPVVYGQRYHVDRGGLISYGTDFLAKWRSAARFVDRILKGARPGELPIEQPTRFELVINLKAARAIGVEVPRTLLLRADEVIE